LYIEGQCPWNETPTVEELESHFYIMALYPIANMFGKRNGRYEMNMNCTNSRKLSEPDADGRS
jgi:hypothetical protein